VQVTLRDGDETANVGPHVLKVMAAAIKAVRRAKIPDPMTASLPQSLVGITRTLEDAITPVLRESLAGLADDVREFVTKFPHGWLARLVLLIVTKEPTADPGLLYERIFLWTTNLDNHEAKAAMVEALRHFEES
jgi:hypothetical protein